MSRLTAYINKSPETVVIDGKEYQLNGNHKICLLTMFAVWDKELLPHEKADIIMENMYNEPYPENTDEAVRLALKYIMQNRTDEEIERDSNNPVVLDFEQDGQLIYDALFSNGTDLDKSDTTFWQLMSLLRELPEDCMLRQIIRWRTTPSSKLTKEDWKAINKIGVDVVFINQDKYKDRDVDDETARKIAEYEKYLNGE